MKNLLFFASLFFAILCTGCSSDKDNSDAEDCSEVICTDEFCSIGVKIKYEDDTSVVLDSYEVIEVATGKVRDVLNWGKEFNTLEKETIHFSRMLEQIVSEFEPILQEKRLSCSLLVK